MTLAEKIQRYTYVDYLSWPSGERWELIGGIAFNMTPAPSFKHQRGAGLFYHLLESRLTGSACIPGIAPMDVVLSDHDVVQPDVFVVCDAKKITDNNIQGAPDLIVEVLSPATAIKDKREKKALYERHGVREYLLADPIATSVERYVLNDGRYGSPEIFGPPETVLLRSLEGVELPLKEIFGA